LPAISPADAWAVKVVTDYLIKLHIRIAYLYTHAREQSSDFEQVITPVHETS